MHAAVYLQYKSNSQHKELIAVVRPRSRGGINTNSARFASLVDYWRAKEGSGDNAVDSLCGRDYNRGLKESSSVDSKASQANGAYY